MTVTNQQVMRFRQMVHKYNQEVAAAKSGMNVKTARKYLFSNKMPCELKKDIGKQDLMYLNQYGLR